MSTDSKGEKAQQNDLRLMGSWESPCAKLDWLGFSHARSLYKFSAIFDFEKKISFFGGDDCASPIAELFEGGTYASLGASKSAPDADEINLTITAAALTPASAEVAARLSSLKYCGVTDWAEGTKTNILGRECLGLSHPNGEVVFDIYRVDQDGKRLTTGKTSVFLDASSASTRPTKLDESNTFRKI